MKRVFALLLLALLLCGCAAQPPEETTGTTMETLPAVEPTEPTGSYEPDSAMEAATGGAVRAYTPDISDAYAVAVLDGDPVIFSGMANTTLTRLTGENLYITAAVTLDTWLDPSAPSVQVTKKGISYYDSRTRELVLLGTGLKEIGRVALPEDIVGEPVISADRKHIYYCLEHSVWEMTVETGISRMIKEISETFASAGGLLMENTVLQCSLEDRRQIFLSTEVGKTLWQGDGDITVTGAGNNWYAVVPEGIIQAYVYGTGEDDKQMLLLESFEGTGRYLADMNCLVSISGAGKDTRLDCFDLGTGKRISALETGDTVLHLASNAAAGVVCVLTGEGSLYLWNVAALPTGEETVYSMPRYTLESPDEAGYEQCAAYAEEIGDRYGVRILFGEAAVAVQPKNYDLTGEYMVPVLMAELEKLDALLSMYPEGMLEAAADTTGGTLYICLVREVAGSAELGIPDTVGGTQYWNGSDSYVAMAVGSDGGDWYHQMYHALETKLMSDSKACYDWEYLNPEGFDYDYNYILNQDREDGGWLEGENRYFIDLFSMSFPREDRAAIMAYAMMENCGEYFATEAMQAKLHALCVGLREAYGLQKSPDTFLWEQYLSESLAYTK